MLEENAFAIVANWYEGRARIDILLKDGSHRFHKLYNRKTLWNLFRVLLDKKWRMRRTYAVGWIALCPTCYERDDNVILAESDLWTTILMIQGQTADKLPDR